MKKKFLLLIPCVLIACTAITSIVKAQEAIIAVDPPSYTAPEPSHTFPVNITITNVIDLWSWKIRLSWNPSTLSLAVDPDTGDPLIEEGPFLKAAGSTLFLFKPPNQTGGYIKELSCTLMVSKEVSGSGTLATITFNATAVGESNITMPETDLVDLDENPISCTVINGAVTVVPEFPASLILPLFLTITAITALIAKMVWPRKRRGYINTP